MMEVVSKPVERAREVRSVGGWRSKGEYLSPLKVCEFRPPLGTQIVEADTPRSVATISTPRQCTIAFLVDDYVENVTPRDIPSPSPTTSVGEADGSVQISESAGETSPIESPRDLSAEIFVDRQGEMTSFGCGVCKRRFRVKRDLRQHIKCVHEKIRPFSCDLCDKKFSIKPNLKRHVLTVHEKQRPYDCNQCGKAFGLKENFQKHVKMVHEKQRPLRCTTCHKDFTSKVSLRRHMESHENRLNSFLPSITATLSSLEN